MFGLTTNSSRKTSYTTLAASSFALLILATSQVEAKDDSLTFTAFGGTTQKVMTATIIDPFVEKTGIKVTQDQPTDYAKIKAMTRANKTYWDVVDGEAPIVKQQCGKLFEKLDMDKLDTSGIPDNLMVTECAVPSYRTGIVVFYNADAYKDKPAPSSWKDFFDTQTYPGKRSLGGDPLYVLGPIMKAVTGDNDKAYPIDYDKVFAKLDGIEDKLITWKTGAQAVQQMVSGQANMIATWPGRASEAVEQGANYKPIWSTAEFSYDVWAIPKGSQHVEAAIKLINFAITPETESRFANKLPYAATNKKSIPAPTSSINGQFAMTFEKQDKYDVLIRDQGWWADHWDEAHDKFSAWSFK